MQPRPPSPNEIDTQTLGTQTSEIKIQDKKLEEKSDHLEVQLSFRETEVTHTGLFVLTFPSSSDAKLFSQSITESLPEGMMLRGKELILKLYKNTNVPEYNFIMGSNQALLNFLNGLGLQPETTKTYPKINSSKKIQSLQAEYTYLDSLIKTYDAITPHVLPDGMTYDAFYQRHKIYFSQIKLNHLKQSLLIPRPGSFPPAKSYSRTLGINNYFQTLQPQPSTSMASKLYYFINEQQFTAPLLPGIEFRIAKKGALVLTFDSKTDAQYAALKMGQFQLDRDKPSVQTDLIRKQMSNNTDLIIPFINGNELRFPLQQSNNEYFIYLENNCENFLKLFDSQFDKKQTDQHALMEHFLPDFKQNVIQIKDAEKLIQLKRNPEHVFKFIFPPNNLFLSTDKTLINQCMQNIFSSSSISQRAKDVITRLLTFAAKNHIDLTETAKQTHLVIPLRLKNILNDFLLYKKTVEPDIFEKITLDDFIKRLMTARPAMFMGASNNTKYWPGQQARDCLTYDEIPVAAMLISSSFTHFINSGIMKNYGKAGDPGTYNTDGICMNLVGTRLEKPGECEYAHVIVTPKQNTAKNGYGQNANKKNHHTVRNNIWAKLYGSTHLPSYDEVKELKKDPRYIDIGNKTFFNIEIYIKRTYLLLEAYLLEANQRAQTAGKSAYIHLMGFGNGVWSLPQIRPIQNRLFPLICDLVLKNNKLEHVSDIHFSYLSLNEAHKKCGSATHGDMSTSGENKVTMWFYDHPPTAKLEGEHQNKLLVRLYQGDGGCSPGNEFWKGLIAASGEPAAIASSYVGFYQNPRINTDWLYEMTIDNNNLYRGNEQLPVIESLLKIDWHSTAPLEITPEDKKDSPSLLRLPIDQESSIAQHLPVSAPPGVLSRLSIVGISNGTPENGTPEQQLTENNPSNQNGNSL